MLHNIVIKQRKVYLKNNRFVQGGINSDEISVFFDPEWEACDTTLVTFQNDHVDKTETYLIEQGKPLLIPKSMLAEAGFLYISFTGYVGEEMRLTTERMTHVYCGKVYPSGVVAEEGEDSHPDELDFLASLIKEVQDIIEYFESGAGSGAFDYSKLTNKPSIEGVLLEGNKLLSDFGLIAITEEEINQITTE